MSQGLERRVERVRVLLGSLNDPYPTPRGALRTEAGPSPSRYMPCETCRSRGEVRKRSGWALCLLCDGTGWKRRRADEEAWDAYLELPVAVAVELPIELAPAAAIVDDAGYGWERARDAYDRHGSYKELRVQLRRLATASPRRHRLVQVVLVEHGDVKLDEHARAELELGVVAIALGMRSLRVPRWLMDEQPSMADDVAALAAAGMGAGEIARKTGISKETVKRRLRKRRQRETRRRFA